MNSNKICFSRRASHLVAALLTAFAVGFGACPNAVAQDRQAIAGTSVSLVAPKGFTPATGFAGLANQATQASVLIMEMPAVAHPQLVPLFSDMATAKTNFAKQNIAIASIDEVATTGGDKAPVISGTQTAGGARLDKWIGLFKGEKTVMVTVQAPKAAALGHATVLALMSSVSLGKEPTLAERLAALPFTLTPAEPFRVIDTIAGSGVLMTAGELNTDPAGKQPLLIVAYQLSVPAAASTLEATAEATLRQTRDYRTAKITARERIRFAGTDGLLLSGTFDHANGTTKRFVQYMAFDPKGRFVRMIASADDASFEKLQPTIAAIAGSVAFAAGK
ncbi:hypothetical protein J2Y55_000166 [Bosea sp. BE125]|uniref:hypothetical protein n=1 Tax=Bosea sp. BE125 TaxID=2817909 RepID=UPI0028623B23|nr:hypothetical protein [Bosea sp. BE125]MDR6869173.1 hypothetical protein [Bosea sp. BE125]